MGRSVVTSDEELAFAEIGDVATSPGLCDIVSNAARSKLFTACFTWSLRSSTTPSNSGRHDPMSAATASNLVILASWSSVMCAT
jgi:hypothetical protein